EMAAATDRMAFDGAEFGEAEMLVERPRLEIERVEPDAGEPLLARPGLGLQHEPAPVSLPAQRFRHREELHEQPVVKRVAGESADHGAAHWILEQQSDRLVVATRPRLLGMRAERGADGLDLRRLRIQ